MEGCLLCDHARADAELQRIEVWRDDLWRLTMSVAATVPGFAYLEPLRHIPHITELAGREAETLGPVLARCTAVLKQAAGSELVYVNVFGSAMLTSTSTLLPTRPATRSPVAPACSVPTRPCSPGRPWTPPSSARERSSTGVPASPLDLDHGSTPWLVA